MINSNALEEAVVKFSIPLYTVLILTEIVLSNYQHKSFYSVKDTITNMVYTILNASIDLLFRSIYFVVLVYFYSIHLFQFQNPYIYWFALFFLEDFAFYVLHCVDHYCRFFWATHFTHHSSNLFNLTTGFRSSVFQPIYRFIYFIPIALLGFQPADIVLMYAITQIYGICVHTNYIKTFGFLNYIFVDPSHHRVHHGSNVEYLDKNMGMCLIIFDRIFGTFQEEMPEVKVKYGLLNKDQDPNPIKGIFTEYIAIIKDFISAPNIKIGLKYIFYPPGWSHDGRSKTSSELRKELSATLKTT